MSKRKSEKIKFHRMILPGIILVITVIIILSSYGVRMISDAKDQVTKEYQVNVNELCQMYSIQIHTVEAITNLVVDEITESKILINKQNVRTIRMAVRDAGIEDIYLVTPNYDGVDAFGNPFDNVDEVFSLASVMDYKNTSGKFFADEDGNQKLYLCKGIIVQNMVIGYVVVEYAPKLKDVILERPKFTARKTFALISSNGDVIENVGRSTKLFADGDNIIEIADGFDFVNGSYPSFKQAISEGRSGFQQIKYNGENKYLYYGPIEGCNGVVLTVVDNTDVERSFNNVSKNIRSMLIGIGTTLFVFLAVYAGIALFNKAKYSIESEDLQNKADTDQLTDLYNKMATERMIKEYLDGEGKDKTNMLFVIDVDNFKKINDTMGHAFGDKVLSQLGHQIRAWFRVNDIVGRIGGDEFMILVKDVKKPEIIKKEGSRIMQFFEGFSVGEYTKYSPTASVGGAVYPNDASDFESLYKAADKAVYKAKKEGKSRVAFYGDLNKEEIEIEIGSKDA